jgi:hypothetical protein
MIKDEDAKRGIPLKTALKNGFSISKGTDIKRERKRQSVGDVNR